MSLQGVLADFGVADIFQLIAQQRKTGVLAIEFDDSFLEVYFREGQVVRARPSELRPDGALAGFLLRTGGLSEPDLVEARRLQEETLEPLPDILLAQHYVSKPELEAIARLLSDETIFELFLWDEGRFSFRPGGVNEQLGDMMLGAEMVLLDALRMRDEWAQIKTGLPDLSVCMAQTVDVEEYREKRSTVEAATSMSGENLDRLFTRCDGRLTARRVIDLSRLGTFQGARGILALLQEGDLHVAHRARKPQRARRTIVPVQSWGRGAWVLLFTGLLAGGLFLVRAPAPRSHPLPRSVLAEARRDAATERLLQALEAYRWRTGNYPESLEVMVQTPDEFLASEALDGYSYARSEGGYTLLLK